MIILLYFYINPPPTVSNFNKLTLHKNKQINKTAFKFQAKVEKNVALCLTS